MSSQRATLVDHDELADLQDEPPVYGDDLARNQDGQPPPILQVRALCDGMIEIKSFC